MRWRGGRDGLQRYRNVKIDNESRNNYTKDIYDWSLLYISITVERSRARDPLNVRSQLKSDRKTAQFSCPSKYIYILSIRFL